MANDLGSAMNALKGILGDGAEDKIKAVMSSLSADNTSAPQDDAPHTVGQSVQQGGGFDDRTLEYIMRMKGIVDEMSHGNDNRSNLLLSLRPYMREQRQHSIDNALRLMTLTKLSGVFGKL